MPIKLPTIERVAPIAPKRTPLIKGQSINVSSGQQQMDSAILRAAEKTTAIYDRAQRDAYSSKIQAMGHDLEQFGRRKLNGDPNKPGTGLIHVQGDPDEAYRTFDTELGEKYNQLIADSGFSGENLERAKGTLNRRYNTVYNNSLTHYGSQRARYKQRLAKTSVEISKRDAFTALGQYDVRDESTLEPFKQSLDDIRQVRIEEAETVGTARPVPANFKGFKYRKLDPITGENYWLTLDDSVKNQISKDVSKATYESINGMIKGGRIDEARELIKLYGGQIDPVNKAKLDEAFEKKEVEQLSYLNLGKVADLPFKERVVKLKKLPSKTARQVKVKQETLKLNDANQRFQGNEKKRASKSTYDQIATQMQALTDPDRAGNRLVDNSVALENTIVEVDGIKGPVKDFLSQITEASQQKALFKMIEDRPANGDDVAYGRVMDMLRTGEMYNLSYPDLQAMGVGFSKTQWSRVHSVWKTAQDKDSQEKTRASGGFTHVNRIARNMKLLKTKRGSSQLNNTSKTISEELDEEWWQQIVPTIPKGTSQPEINQMARELVVRKKREVESKKGFFKFDFNFFGTADKPDAPTPVAKPAVKGATVDIRKMTPEIKMQLLNQFKKDNEGKTPTLDQLKDLYEKSLSDVSE